MEVSKPKIIKGMYKGYLIEIELRRDITLIGGDSGVGKTLIFKWFISLALKNKMIKCIDFNTLRSAMVDENYIEKLVDSLTNGVIVIDNADVLLRTKKLRRKIAQNQNNNTYILMGRNVSSLGFRFNNVAYLKRDDINKTFTLRFLHDIGAESFNKVMKQLEQDGYTLPTQAEIEEYLMKLLQGEKSEQ